MNLSGNKILLLSLVMGVLFTSSLSYSYGQMIQDLSCSGCIQIKNTDRLEIHKILGLPIILWAEDFTYSFDHNSIITINGHSNLNNPDMPIVFTVTNPIGNLVTIEQIMVKPNSDFKIEFNSASPLWKKDGMYIIMAQAGPQSTIFKTNLNVFSVDSISSLECNSSDITVSSDIGKQYCISFESTFPITQMTGFLNTETKTLSLNVQGNFAQIFDINIDRNLLNAMSSDGTDTEFIVMVNGEPADFEEKDSELAGYRTLSIPYAAGETTIEIIGTFAIPEFGSIAVLILVVTVIAGVVLTSGRIKFPMRIS